MEMKSLKIAIRLRFCPSHIRQGAKKPPFLCESFRFYRVRDRIEGKVIPAIQWETRVSDHEPKILILILFSPNPFREEVKGHHWAPTSSSSPSPNVALKTSITISPPDQTNYEVELEKKIQTVSCHPVFQRKKLCKWFSISFTNHDLVLEEAISVAAAVSIWHPMWIRCLW